MIEALGFHNYLQTSKWPPLSSLFSSIDFSINLFSWQKEFLCHSVYMAENKSSKSHLAGTVLQNTGAIKWSQPHFPGEKLVPSSCRGLAAVPAYRSVMLASVEMHTELSRRAPWRWEKAMKESPDWNRRLQCYLLHMVALRVPGNKGDQRDRKWTGVIKNHSAGAPGGSVGWASNFGSGHDHAVRGLEPCIGLCADGSKPRACFQFCVSLSLCPSPDHTLSLSVSQKWINVNFFSNTQIKRISLKGIYWGVPGWLSRLGWTSARVMILQFVSSSHMSGSVLTPRSMEPVSDSVSPSLCPFPAHALSLSVSQKWISIKKNFYKKGKLNVCTERNTEDVPQLRTSKESGTEKKMLIFERKW